MIYLDNACTSFPKPNGMSQYIAEFIDKKGVNIGRSSYFLSFETMDIVYETRNILKNMFGANSEKNVIFTKNITESLNVVINGLFSKQENNLYKFKTVKPHILVSSLEHNAIMRPLTNLQNMGIISFSRIPCDENGYMQIDKIETLITPNTKAIITQHASNVCGIINPINEIGKICKKNNLLFIIDSAQTAGALNINMEENNIDVLCFTGHKSLLGPQGVGGFILRKEIDKLIDPFILGGTGSFSHEEIQPNILPDKYESGTMPLPNIAGLNYSLKFIQKEGQENIYIKESELTKYFLDAILEIEKKQKIKLIGPKTINNRLGVISIISNEMDNATLSYKLENEGQILTRVGLHCAPNAHKSLNTFPNGTIRFSIGYFNTKNEIDDAISFLNKL